MHKTRGHVEHKSLCRLSVTIADVIGHDQFGVGIDREPQPHVTMTERSAYVVGILRLATNETPDFIGLDFLTGQTTDFKV
jgi:hypothetical protein